MTIEEVIKYLGNEILSFNYYYNYTFQFNSSKGTYIFQGGITVNPDKIGEFELDVYDSISVRDFQEQFTYFKVWRFNSQKSKTEIIFNWEKPQC